MNKEKRPRETFLYIFIGLVLVGLFFLVLFVFIGNRMVFLSPVTDEVSYLPWLQTLGVALIAVVAWFFGIRKR